MIYVSTSESKVSGMICGLRWYVGLRWSEQASIFCSVVASVGKDSVTHAGCFQYRRCSEDKRDYWRSLLLVNMNPDSWDTPDIIIVIAGMTASRNLLHVRLHKSRNIFLFVFKVTDSIFHRLLIVRFVCFTWMSCRRAPVGERVDLSVMKDKPAMVYSW